MNYNCRRCDFSTYYKSNLTRHMIIHKAEDENVRMAALTCHWCSKQFANKHNCKRHEQLNCSQNPSRNHPQVENVNILTPTIVESYVPAAENVNILPDVNQHIAENVNSRGSEEQNVNITTKRFPCPTCYRVYTRRSILMKHTVFCDHTDDPLQCKHCHGHFSCRASKSKHMQTCKAAMNIPVLCKRAEPMVPCNVVNTNSNNTTTNIQNNITTHNHIVINSFGNEYIGHVTPEFLAMQALRMNGDGVVKCIEKVHFDPERPENHNMRLVYNVDVPKTAIAVYDNDQWNLRDYYNTIKKLIQHTLFVLRDRAIQDDFRKKYADCWSTVYGRLQKLTEQENPHDFYAIMRQVKLLLQSFDKVAV